jgi:integrase
LPDLCVRALREYQEAQHHLRMEQGLAWIETGYLFTTRHGAPIEPRKPHPHVHPDLREARLRRIRLHDLRHSCVSLLLALGVLYRAKTRYLG